MFPEYGLLHELSSTYGWNSYPSTNGFSFQFGTSLVTHPGCCAEAVRFGAKPSNDQAVSQGSGSTRETWRSTDLQLHCLNFQLTSMIWYVSSSPGFHEVIRRLSGGSRTSTSTFPGPTCRPFSLSQKNLGNVYYMTKWNGRFHSYIHSCWYLGPHICIIAVHIIHILSILYYPYFNNYGSYMIRILSIAVEHGSIFVNPPSDHRPTGSAFGSLAQWSVELHGAGGAFGMGRPTYPLSFITS